MHSIAEYIPLEIRKKIVEREYNYGREGAYVCETGYCPLAVALLLGGITPYVLGTVDFSKWDNDFHLLPVKEIVIPGPGIITDCFYRLGWVQSDVPLLQIDTVVGEFITEYRPNNVSELLLPTQLTLTQDAPQPTPKA
jgi:hypothetical protein